MTVDFQTVQTDRHSRIFPASFPQRKNINSVLDEVQYLLLGLTHTHTHTNVLNL